VGAKPAWKVSQWCQASRAGARILGVQAQLQRVKCEHGQAFHRLVDQAGEQLYGADPAALKSFAAQPLGHNGRDRSSEEAEEGGSGAQKFS
jgi:hypothetical protein